jgi:hypothetical protein
MRHYVILAAVAALLTLPDYSSAQERVSIDVRGVLATTTEDLGDADLGLGFGFGATLGYRLQPHLHLYGGWDWLHFTADDSFAGTEADFEETGYTFGLRFEHPLGLGSRRAFRLEAGGTYKHVEIEDDDGDLIADSDHSLGYEVGAGLVLPLGAEWRLTPMGRFRSLDPEFDIGSVTMSGTFRYVALEVGLTRRF